MKVKVKKNGLVRMETLINNDRIKNSDGFMELLTLDISKVLKDYFDYKGSPQVDVVKNGSVFSVSVSVAAEGIKSFLTIPKENEIY